MSKFYLILMKDDIIKGVNYDERVSWKALQFHEKYMISLSIRDDSTSGRVTIASHGELWFRDGFKSAGQSILAAKRGRYNPPPESLHHDLPSRTDRHFAKRSPGPQDRRRETGTHLFA